MQKKRGSWEHSTRSRSRKTDRASVNHSVHSTFENKQCRLHNQKRLRTRQSWIIHVSLSRGVYYIYQQCQICIRHPPTHLTHLTHLHRRITFIGKQSVCQESHRLPKRGPRYFSGSLHKLDLHHLKYRLSIR
jgi:hypothetical protein